MGNLTKKTSFTGFVQIRTRLYTWITMHIYWCVFKLVKIITHFFSS